MNNCSKCGAELPEGVKYCEKCGEGSVGAMLDLAIRYRDGKGVPLDINRAFVLAYEAIAKGGKSRTFAVLGQFYQRGDFVGRDYKKSIELFLRSANAGNHVGLYWLGKSYRAGWGVSPNSRAAKFLFEKAVEKGSKKAQDEVAKFRESTRSDSSEILGYTGKADTSPLPDYLAADYEKAKAGTLWTKEMESQKKLCRTCYGKGVVVCKECGGKKKFRCDNCNGTGQVECSKCNDGKQKCTACGGTGKVKIDCPVCWHGKVEKERWINCQHCSGEGYRYVDGERRRCVVCNGRGQVKETYEEICPNCHGDWKGFKGRRTCHVCSGTGKMECEECHGTKKVCCKSCDGTGKKNCGWCSGKGVVVCRECETKTWNTAVGDRDEIKSSDKKRDLYFMLGMTLGLLGVHYAYIRRWGMMLVQLSLTLCGLLQIVVSSWNAYVCDWMMPISSKLNDVGISWLGCAVRYPVLTVAVVLWITGVGFVRKDGANQKVRHDWPTRKMFIAMMIVQIVPIIVLRSLLPAAFGIHLLYSGKRNLFYINLVFVILAEVVNLVVLDWTYSLGTAIIYLLWFAVSAKLSMKFISEGPYRIVQHKSGDVKGGKFHVQKDID